MLALGRSSKISIASMKTHDMGLEEKLEREWLLTNSRGGFSSGTLAGCNTRRYHGLLTGTLVPPANRILALSNLLETIIVDGEEFSISTFEFSDRFSPDGFWNQTGFKRDIGVHFDYEIGPVGVTKSIYLSPDSDTVAIEYDFSSVGDGITFKVRPFAAMRNSHYLQKSKAPLGCDVSDGGIVIRNSELGVGELILRAEAMSFEHNPQWWYNFVYRVERDRGQDWQEDMWSPGAFKVHMDDPAKLVIWAHLGDGNYDLAPGLSIENLIEELRQNQGEKTAVPHGNDKTFQKLCLAGDQFIIKRQMQSRRVATILAGYPWFMDWGRDTFISLEGLLLATERFEEAAEVLTTFAAAAEDGVIPNRFDDFTDKPHYNSIDASMWFIHAAFKYLEKSGDLSLFETKLLPAIHWIVDCYYYGTKFGIHADADGLITGGNAETQLTWMDAKCDGRAITPRYGKAVEINALWYNALCELANYHLSGNMDMHEHYEGMAKDVAKSFQAAFWNAEGNCLYDCIMPDGTKDASIRPNQIFAVSMPYSPLTPAQQKAVVECVQKNLLTPFGLRTLNEFDPRYHGRIGGNQAQRDEAYHQGTVWPWLIGGFIEAHLRVNKFSRKSRREAIEFIRPLIEHLSEDGCIGSIAEVFDGDAPHRPAGTYAQAWSVAEVIRAYLLIID